jgi:hypothetical protein
MKSYLLAASTLAVIVIAGMSVPASAALASSNIDINVVSQKILLGIQYAQSRPESNPQMLRSDPDFKRPESNPQLLRSDPDFKRPESNPQLLRSDPDFKRPESNPQLLRSEAEGNTKSETEGNASK